MNFHISSQGLGLINQEFLQDNFTFVIGNRSYSCNKIHADFLSPIVSKMHKVDPLIDKFEIKGIEDSDGEFQVFIDFLKEGDLKIEPQKFSFYIQISGLLGNSEIIDNLMNLITNEIEKQDFQIERIIEKLILVDQLCITDKNTFIDYVASHFSDICYDLYSKKISYETLESIVSSPSLRLENESQLVTFIFNLVNQEKDEKYLSLIEFVDFEYINYDDLLSLQSILENYQISLKVIVDKLFQKIISTKVSKFSSILNFEYNIDRKNNLNGIINYLNHKSKGISSRNGTINMTCSSTQPAYTNIRHDVRFLCDFNDLTQYSMWSPDNEENCYIQYDFVNNKVNLSSYTFHTPKTPTQDYPKSWQIQCSNNLNDWVVIDKKIDQICMNNENSCHNFKCQSNSNEFFRYVRVVSLGPCWNRESRYYFDLAAIEFFGFLRVEE